MRARKHMWAAATLALACLVYATPTHAQDIRVQNGAALAEVERVSIASFAVAFLTDRVDRARAGGGLVGSGFGGRSTARSALVGLTDADFQRATDAAYADFIRQLAASGYVVADHAPLAAALREAGGRPLDNGAEHDIILGRDSNADARIFAPTGWSGPLMPREWLGMVTAGGFSFNRSAILTSTAGQAYARSNNEAVISVLYVVDFANAETYGGWFRNSSAVSVQAGLAIVPEATQVIAYAPNGRVVTATLREPIAVGGDFGVFADSTTSGQRSAETVANVIGVIGGVGTNRTRRYTMTADAERWGGGVNELTASATSNFLHALESR